MRVIEVAIQVMMGCLAAILLIAVASSSIRILGNAKAAKNFTRANPRAVLLGRSANEESYFILDGVGYVVTRDGVFTKK